MVRKTELMQINEFKSESGKKKKNPFATSDDPKKKADVSH